MSWQAASSSGARDGVNSTETEAIQGESDENNLAEPGQFSK
jgi:hypothetical protein